MKEGHEVRKGWQQRTHPCIPRKTTKSLIFKTGNIWIGFPLKRIAERPINTQLCGWKASGPQWHVTLWPEKQSKVSRLLRTDSTWDSPNPRKSINQHRLLGIAYRSYRDLYHIQSSKSVWSMKQPERQLCTHTRKPSVNVFTEPFSKIA